MNDNKFELFKDFLFNISLFTRHDILSKNSRVSYDTISSLFSGFCIVRDTRLDCLLARAFDQSLMCIAHILLQLAPSDVQNLFLDIERVRLLPKSVIVGFLHRAITFVVSQIFAFADLFQVERMIVGIWSRRRRFVSSNGVNCQMLE